jgi:putative endonuclease
MASHNDLGKKGEELAAEYLSSLGYEILERNYRFEKSEVDIIARIGNDLVFVEVKTRTTALFGNPEEAVSAAKRKKMIQAAENYLETKQSGLEPRFDVIAITGTTSKHEIHHIEDAFFFE